tara:strand:+ start:349 stop:597 length:249 start_codon:yes stop_codon:yes gene_type:complete
MKTLEDIKQAIGILQTHNKWRRGCDIEPMTNPTTLGIAIDTVIEYVKNNIVLDDVIKCENFKCNNKAEYFYCNDCENERNDI